MKLSPRSFRVQWDVHAWVGVVASLLGFVTVFFGVFALFVDDLRVWQDPALHAAEQAPPSFDRLLELASEPDGLPQGSSVAFWRHPGTRLVQTFVSNAETGARQTLWIDPDTGTRIAERTRLAEELYRMHFFDRVPRGMEIAGLFAIALLVALLSGLLMHLRALPRQWWRFRPTLRLRLAASDAHKVLGVFTLPFAALVIWSGAVLCLAGLQDQAVTAAVFPDDPGRVGELSGDVSVARKPSGEAAAALSPDAIVARAQAAAGTDAAPGYFVLYLLGDAQAYARIDFPRGDFSGWRRWMLDATSGEVLAGTGARPPSRLFEETMWDLHFAEYGGALLEILYAVLALALCAVILTGNLVWLERRDPNRSRPSSRVLERLTVGVAGGAVFGAAVALAANRLLPWDLGDRTGWELRALVWSWGLAVALAFVPRLAPRALVVGLALASSVLFAGVVVGDAATLDANLVTALARNLPAVLAVELLLCALGLGCGVLAWALAKRRRRPPSSAPNGATAADVLRPEPRSHEP